MKNRTRKSIFMLPLIVSLFAAAPVEFGVEGDFFHGFMIPKPIIKIGLGTNLKDIRIQASSGMKIYEVNSMYRLVSDDADEVQVKGGSEKITEKYVVLVAHTREREEADLLAAELKRQVGGRVYVEENLESAAGGVFEVKVGDFLTRGQALEAIKSLNAAGRKDVWILREDVVVGESKPIWMIIENELMPLGRESNIFFIPANPESLLSFRGRSYRGFFILRGTRRGVVLINVLNLDDYLKGVVPGELSPDQFGAIEALKAQAVAARTYAIKNMGQFKEYGYDLVASTRSQLYSGLTAERPLSTRAVEETAGEVVRYKGKLINALYTSTCGGRTENVENVFPGSPSPYLKSVECTYEKQPEWHIESKSPLAPITVWGRNASVDVAFLAGLGVIPIGVDAVDFRLDCRFDEAVEWIRAALRRLGLKGGEFVPDAAPLDFVGLSDMLVRAFGWQEKVRRLVLPSEADFVVKDMPPIDPKDRKALAYCLQSGIFPDRLRTGNPRRPVSRAELAMALSRIIRAHKNFFQTGIFRSAGRNTIEVGRDFERKTLRLMPRLFLLRNLDGEAGFASHLTLLGGERVQWVERDNEVSYLEVFYPPNSNVLDRSSRYNRWQVRKSRDELEKRIGQSYAIGRLVDISARTRGASGRVSKLLITGTKEKVTVSGLQICSVLGLRDTLFVVDRSWDEAGGVEAFTFSGRGWGHGVGLCQVGAYGMAIGGAGYRDILKKYYSGVRIDKIY